MKSNENRGCQIPCADEDFYSDCSDSGGSCYRTPLNTPRNQHSQIRRQPSSDLNLVSMQCCDDSCCCCVASQRDRMILSPKYFHSQISVKELVKYFNCLQNRDSNIQTLTGRFSNRTMHSPNPSNWNTYTRNSNLTRECYKIQGNCGVGNEAGINLSENVKADEDRFRNVCVVRRKKKPPRQHGIQRTDVATADLNQKKQCYDCSPTKGECTMQGTEIFDTNNDDTLLCKNNTTADVSNCKVSSVTGGSNTKLSSTEDRYVSKEKRRVWGPSGARLRNVKNLSNVECNDTIFSWRNSKHKTYNDNNPKTDKESRDSKELIPSSGSSVMCASNGKYSSDKPHLALPKKHHRSKTMSIVVDINFGHSGERLGSIPMHFKADRKRNVLKQSISIPFI
ncbi:Hypothetical predicted protein [Octopus vulgaris]|uniref:Uncharacterized protein n=1 Tax=Octopus vulgaris TaxID=6645 RepID=A0AA36B8D0_OCTVU|nr:Hypothetical predicted protein [Octopus vulgaris]